MKLFENKSVYDSEEDEWIELYFVDGKEVTEAEYIEAMEDEEEIEYCEFCGERIEDCECDDEDCCCGQCCELSDEKIEEINIFAEYRANILKANGCPDCTLRLLVDFANIFKNIGFEDARVLMGSFLEELE